MQHKNKPRQYNTITTTKTITITTSRQDNAIYDKTRHDKTRQ